MAQELVTAWIAAGAAVAGAVAGGTLTGWFTLASARRQAQGAVEAAVRQADAAWAAGRRQADAAWEAGRRQAEAAWEAGRLQADAQLSVAHQTLTAQTMAAQHQVRRAAYVSFLARTDLARHRWQEWQNALGSADATTRRDAYRAALRGVDEALNVVRLEGPDSVAAAAEGLEQALGDTAAGDQHAAAHSRFLQAARAALAPTP
ncbi:hypothetical protein ACFVZC_20825 [Streptomyces marokkonensis]|uniref:Secreted protein n=1 Tax=Streptomyces marokkonensis TaxID=324855 RepID=A0ABW6Q9F4_9ACTN